MVRFALLAMLAGTVVLLAAIDEQASAEIVTLPLLLLGLGIGALASRLGAVTVSAVPDELSPEVGVPFLSDADAQVALEQAGVDDETATAIVDENATARLGALRAALTVIALVALAALFFTGPIPTPQPGSPAADAGRAPPSRQRAPA